ALQRRRRHRRWHRGRCAVVVLLSRRRFLRASGGAMCAAAGLGVYTWRIEPHWLEVVHHPLAVRQLPASLAGRTLVQITDVHVGTRVDDDYVIESFRRAAALKPDIVAFTGDFISHHATVFPQMTSVYQHFPKG